jgi:hypothetical protein
MGFDETEVKVLTPELSHFPKHNTQKKKKKNSMYFSDNIWQMNHFKKFPQR